MNKGNLHLSFLTGIKHVIIFLVLASVSATGATINTFGSEDIQNNAVTIRVNTFRRLDLLGIFLEHYHKCQNVKQIQIIWSDQESTPPLEWLVKYPKDKVVFEVHRNNSLNNRFQNLIPITTEAVLSIDDDLVTPCVTLDSAVQVWMSNKNVLLGFSPRMTTYDIITGQRRYLRWQNTWWSGTYSIILTKACLLHRDYLDKYFLKVPRTFLDFIDEKKNCEDIAMAHTIARESRAAPVWFSGTIFETGTTGISSQSSHFIDRGHCLSYLEQLTGFDNWALAYQKVVPLDVTSIYRWWGDTK